MLKFEEDVVKEYEEKGGEHLEEMLLPGLGAIYHSPLCEEETRQMIREELLQRNIIKAGEELLPPHISAPPKKIDIQKFAKIMKEHLPSYSALEDKL